MTVQVDSPSRLVLNIFAPHGDHDSANQAAIACYALAIVLGLWLVVPKAIAALRMRRAEMNQRQTLQGPTATGISEWPTRRRRYARRPPWCWRPGPRAFRRRPFAWREPVARPHPASTVTAVDDSETLRTISISKSFEDAPSRVTCLEGASKSFVRDLQTIAARREAAELESSGFGGRRARCRRPRRHQLHRGPWNRGPAFVEDAPTDGGFPQQWQRCARNGRTKIKHFIV